MARKGGGKKRRPQSDRVRPEPQATPDEVAEVPPSDEPGGSAGVLRKQAEKPAPPSPPPVEVPERLIVIMFSVVGLMVGGLASYANWNPPILAGFAGVVGGMACGASIGRSVLLPARLQYPILAAMIALGYGLYVWFAPRHLQMLAPVMAGGISLVLCVLASRTVDSTPPGPPGAYG
ncbi:MAG: hypothetical protein ACYCW6_22680 [Candidatus Xenobia bacterium]